MMNEIIIVKDISVEKIETKIPYYDVVTFEKSNSSIDYADRPVVIQMCQKTERVDIHRFFIDNKEFGFGITEKAEEKLPVLSLLNILIEEKDSLRQQLEKQNNKVADLTIRLADYEKSKIIKFLHFIKIL